MKALAIGAVLAFGMATVTPAVAQDTSGQMGTMGNNGTSGSMSSGSMSSGSMSSGSMSSGSMTKSQMAAMKRCQAMSSTMMMKNKKCAGMARMHPEMMQSSATSSGD